MNRTSLLASRPADPSLRDRAGYSLIELLGVVVLLGILAGIAAPRIDFRRHLVAGAMEVAGTSLLKAQRLAVQGQHNVVVAVDVEGARLRIHADRDNDLRIDAGEPVRYEPLGEGVRVGRGAAPALMPGSGPVSFTREQDGWPALIFYRNGSASEEGGFYLTSARAADSREQASDARAVRVERATGRPSWYRYAPPGWKREY